MGRTKIAVVLALILAAFASATAAECYESSVMSPTPFMGNNDEIFRLADGSVWEVKYEYEYLYAYYPAVIICPSQGRLIIDGNSLNVQLISAGNRSASPKMEQSATDADWEIYEETNLQGSISGTVQLGSIFKTISGNVYEVTGLTLQLVLELQPDVLVLRRGNIYKLVVDGFDEPLICRKLN